MHCQQNADEHPSSAVAVHQRRQQPSLHRRDKAGRAHLATTDQNIAFGTVLDGRIVSSAMCADASIPVATHVKHHPINVT